jgi:hypothetical protein
MSAPRLAPTLRPCRACGAQGFFRVAPVREHGHAGEPTPMAVVYLERRRELSRFARAVSCVGPKIELRPFGTWLVVVCGGCGDARWYARELEPEIAAELPAAVQHCECGDHRALRVDVARTRGPGGDPSPLRVHHYSHRRWGFTSQASAGRFSTLVCRGCGKATWIASGVEKLAARPAEPCAHCADPRRVTIEPVNEDGATLRVLYDRVHMKDVRIGSYALSICAGCGTTSWTARDFAALEADDRLGVALLEAGDAQEGPYR